MLCFLHKNALHSQLNFMEAGEFFQHQDTESHSWRGLFAKLTGLP
jgi:hypothetical protein